MNFSGSVSGVSGPCPNVTFHVGPTTVVTDAATTYQHGDCGDLKPKAQVSGSGIVQPDGSVLATSISFNKG